MWLQLLNFGCYTSKTYKLEEGGLVTIVGKGGAGKTTIVRALFWLLSGQTFTDMARHGAPPKSKVQAQLQWGGLTIFRQLTPELLTVTLAGPTGTASCQGAEAQKYLQQIFGSGRSLGSSGYLDAKSIHPVLSVSPKERLALLQEISQIDEDPAPIIEAAGQKIREYQQQYTSTFLQVENFRRELEAEQARCRWDYWLPPERRPEIMTQMMAIPEKYRAAQAELERQIAQEAQVRLLQAELQKLPTAPVGEGAELLQRKTALVGLLQQWQMYNIADQQRLQAEKLRAELARLGTEEDFAVGDLPALAEAWRKWQEVEPLLRAFDLPLTGERGALLPALAQQLTVELTWRRHQPIVSKVEELRKSLPPAPAESLESLRARQFQLQSELGRERGRPCPKCSTTLMERAGKLEVFEQGALRPVAELQAELASISGQLAAWAAHERARANLSAFEAMIPAGWSELVSSRNSPASWAALSTELLAKALVLDLRQTAPTLSLAQAQQRIEARQLRDRLAGLQLAAVPRPERAQAELQAELTRVESELREQEQARLALSRRSDLQSQLQSLGPSPPLQAAREQVEALAQEFNRYRLQVESWQASDEWLRRQATLTERRAAADALQQTMQDWVAIRQALSDSEFTMIEQTVGILNEALAQLVPALISDFALQLTLKRNDRAEVGYILYRTLADGEVIELRTVRSVSGSEMARLSLALLLACRAVTKCPWFCLDETFSSMNPTFCDRAREAIREHLNKVPGTAFIINHHDVEGAYDQILEVGGD